MNRLLGFAARLTAQAVPAGGVYFASWATGSALALYWVESVLLLMATLVLVARSPKAPSSGEIPKWRDVAIVHGGAYAVFGGFLAGFILVASENHGISFVAADFKAGLPLMALCVAVGLGVDLADLKQRGPALVSDRVEDGNGRFAVFWLVGFFGTLGAVISGRPGALFAVFAGAKTLFEVGRLLASAPGAPRATHS